MEPKNNITLAPGKLYFAPPGERPELLGDINDGIEDEVVELDEPSPETLALMSTAFGDLSFSVKLAAAAFEKMVCAVTGVTQAVFDACPNRRVVHLAKHAKKERTKKKNYRRAFRMAEKEAKK